MTMPSISAFINSPLSMTEKVGRRRKRPFTNEM
jgi:hypothetical protein